MWGQNRPWRLGAGGGKVSIVCVGRVLGACKGTNSDKTTPHATTLPKRFRVPGSDHIANGDEGQSRSRSRSTRMVDLSSPMVIHRCRRHRHLHVATHRRRRPRVGCDRPQSCRRAYERMDLPRGADLLIHLSLFLSVYLLAQG